MPCEECPLGDGSRRVPGEGPAGAGIAFIGEAPGEEEERERRPFVGRSGRLLTALVDETLHLKRGQVYITNVVQCRPPANRKPTAKEIKACRANWEAEITAVNPGLVVACGATALGVVEGSNKAVGGILARRGVPFYVAGRRVLPVLHPAAALRNPAWVRLIAEDLGRIPGILGSEAVKLPAVRVLTDPGEIARVCKEMRRAPALAFDVEAEGLVPLPGRKIWAIGLSIDPTWGVSVPWDHPDAPAGLYARLAVRQLLEDPKVKKVGHNLPFDVAWLTTNAGIRPKNLAFDTLMAAQRLDDTQTHGLKALTVRMLGWPDWGVEFAEDGSPLPLDELCPYNALDATATFAIYPRLRAALLKLPRLARHFVYQDMAVSRAVIHLMTTGRYFDLIAAGALWIEMQAEIDALVKKIQGYAGESFNPASNKQVGELLFGTLGLPPVRLTPKGAPSVDKGTLYTLGLQSSHPVIQDLLHLRRKEKLMGTYLEPLIKTYARRLGPAAAPVPCRGHYVYPLYHAAGTDTGRLSSSRPNIQNFPRVDKEPRLRGLFTAPPGFVIMSADYSQLELRILAHETGDPALRAAYRSGEDIHTKTAMAIFGLRADQVTKEQRHKAKSTNFGLPYGKSWQGHKRDVFEESEGAILLSDDEARAFHRTWFATYLGVPRWHRRIERRVQLQGYIENALGLRKLLPGVHSPDYSVRGEAFRMAYNLPIQSLAVAICSMSMVALTGEGDPRDVLPREWGYLVAHEHDALQFYIRRDRVAEAEKHIRRVMENPPLDRFGVSLTVPLVVDIKTEEKWT